MPPSPARIHVLLPRDAGVGLVLRRGPARRVAAILWDRKRDRFELGQWLKGRIYERRSDISPDGKYVIYFATRGFFDRERGIAWTAISQVPYLKALVFYPQFTTYWGGGLWTGKTTYWFHDGCVSRLERDSDRVARNTTFVPPSYFGCELYNIYYYRLQRDGWKATHLDGRRDIFEKRVGHGWILRKVCRSCTREQPGPGYDWDEHELVGPNDQLIECPKWEWADLDRKRLVWAECGKLFAAKVVKEGLKDVKELCDFNDMEFEERIAPY